MTTPIMPVQTLEQKANVFIVKQWTWVTTHALTLGIGAALGFFFEHFAKI